MSEHPVRQTLRRDLLPYIVTSRRLRRQWFYRLHIVFGYTTDFVVALAAIGVSTPLLSLLGSLSNTQRDPIQSPAMVSALSAIPTWLFYPMAILIILWVFLRIAFNREEGQKRAVLAKSCFQLLRQAEANLPTILSKPEPMKDLTQLLEKVRLPVDRNIQDEVWPWTPFAPGIEVEVANELDSLCSKYEADWIEPPALQQHI